MNARITQSLGRVSTVFAGTPVQDDLGAGIQGGFGLIGYKGKKWSIRYRGEETGLMRPDGDGAMNSIELIILKASTVIAKNYYEAGYTEGSTAAPDCFSTNGVVPDPNVSKRQNPTCGNCPQNAWGSKVTEAGKKGKACADSKRLAIIPLGNGENMAGLRNEVYGGPMLLRVPAASLQELASYGQSMKTMGYPYYAIGTKISFDVNEAYPKFVFSPIRALTDEEATIVAELRDSEQVTRILSEALENAVTAPNDPQTAQPFAQAPQQAPPARQEAPRPAPKVTPLQEDRQAMAARGAPPTQRAPQRDTSAFGGAPISPTATPATTPVVATPKVADPMRTQTTPLEGEVIPAPVRTAAKQLDMEIQPSVETVDNPINDDGAESTGTNFDATLDSKLAALFGS